MASTRLLLLAGVTGPALFLIVSTTLGAIRPGYDPMRHFVSLLSLTSAGWPMTVTFLMSGGMIAAGGAGLWTALAPGRGRRAIPIGVGLAGIGLVLAGIFPTDPVQGYPPGTPLEMPDTASPAAVIHVVGAFLLFGGTAAAAAFGARRFALAGESGWAAFSIVCAVIALVANAVTSTPPGTISPLAGVAGLLQRLSLAAGLAWVAVVSARMSRADASRPDRREPGS